MNVTRTRTLRLAGLLAALLLLVGTASASAQAPYSQDTVLPAAETAAMSYWAPSCGTPVLTVTVLDPGTLGVPDPTTCSTEISRQLVIEAPMSPPDFMSLCEVVTYEVGQVGELSSAPFDASQTTRACLSATNHVYVIYGHRARAKVRSENGTCTARFVYRPKLPYHTTHLGSETWAC